MARRIRAGTVAVSGYSEGDISTPFGGDKTSGFGGRDNGLEALEQYSQVKTVWLTIR
jgi:gamma-glutamyl-gamma-aminobutyraldehyde dehydrogenase